MQRQWPSSVVIRCQLAAGHAIIVTHLSESVHTTNSDLFRIAKKLFPCANNDAVRSHTGRGMPMCDAVVCYTCVCMRVKIAGRPADEIWEIARVRFRDYSQTEWNVCILPQWWGCITGERLLLLVLQITLITVWNLHCRQCRLVYNCFP